MLVLGVDLMAATREFDIVVHGATGYTGSLVVKYLASASSAAGVKWAVSGRSAARLADVARDAGATVPTIECDAAKPETIEAMTRRCRVVVACAGPFALVGMPVVDACMKSGTHYVDITGEFPFVRRMIEQYHDAAVRDKVCLVPCAGFDSVPSDVCNFMAHKVAADTKVGQLGAVDVGVKVKGGASNGTMESVANIIKTIQKADMHPLCLVPSSDRWKAPRTTVHGIGWNREWNSWRAPFLMAGVNERIVFRSNYLRGDNQQAQYREMMLAPLAACVAVFVSQFVLLGMRIGVIRSLLQRFVFPPSRGGPSAKQRAAGHFTFQAAGYAKPGDAQPKVRCSMKYDMDPYTFTAMSASEVALTILRGEHQRCGVVTPTAAAGDALLTRLAGAGVTFNSKL